ncbi:choice-of-anchor D domain-containing protein [Mycobacterium sp. OTB74]|jgi:hypothetical protein|uniref:choice-of-anchor D domain-containing protein n=1 Tax=Mycobacterium sp. OTB74 TaxID=1853452 RepID=UPI00247729A1|nr:choice-of-anchor D domain-containing protein [Mycobacterium sp. OTB74]MDH6247759.1 hypothetical protein [Mycobacterium sp. OTB74]
MPESPRQKLVDLEGSERRHLLGTERVGPADPAEEITVIVSLRQRPDGPPLPDMEHWASTPPGQRQYVTQEQAAELYGSAPDEVELVASFATERGLRVVEASPARRSVQLTGSVAQIDSAFGIELSIYRRGSQVYRGHDGPVRLPSAVAEVVVAVFGLDNRPLAARAAGVNPDGSGVTPPEVAGLYGLPSIPSSISGQTIAIWEFGGGYVTDASGKPTDVDAYLQALGLPAPTVLPPVPILGGANVLSGTPGHPGDDAEVALDMQVVASVAVGAAIAVYFIGTNYDIGWIAAIGAVVAPGPGQPSPSVVTISWAWDEAEWNASQLAAMNGMWALASAMGKTIFAASGDKGSMGNADESDGRAHVCYPACDPWVTAVGGTSIYNVSGSSFDEITWNDNGVTAGGISTAFGLPSWQVGVGIPPSINNGTTVGRGVPDVAGYANGYEISLYGEDGGSWWGTSEASPLYAAMVAVFNANLGYNLGHFNSTIYALAMTIGADIFRDIDDGRSNAFTFTEQPPNPPTTITSPGYNAVKGWDACTGLGSLRAGRFYAALAKLPILASAVAGGGNFGSVCTGSWIDQMLTIDNSGFGSLAISDITSSSPDFLAPTVASYPLAVEVGASIDVVLRFAPGSAGLKTATITVTSNDPASPHLIEVAGIGETPRLSVVVPNSGDFGEACVKAGVGEALILNNSSRCPLTVTGVVSSDPEFVVPAVAAYPLLIGSGGSLPLPVRFAPTSVGPHSATITIDSDDPAGPHKVAVSGVAAGGHLTVTGSSVFGGVKCETTEQRTISLCNTGDCDLRVTEVALRHGHPEFRLINDPAPVTVHPGCCLAVVIEYRAIEREPHPCQLLIKSDDPSEPMKLVDVVAYTVWDCSCDPCCANPRCSCRTCQESRNPCRCGGGDRDDCLGAEHRDGVNRPSV